MIVTSEGELATCKYTTSAAVWGDGDQYVELTGDLKMWLSYREHEVLAGDFAQWQLSTSPTPGGELARCYWRYPMDPTGGRNGNKRHLFFGSPHQDSPEQHPMENCGRPTRPEAGVLTNRWSWSIAWRSDLPAPHRSVLASRIPSLAA